MRMFLNEIDLSTQVVSTKIGLYEHSIRNLIWENCAAVIDKYDTHNRNFCSPVVSTARLVRYTIVK